jgi:signal transduction histidine kinase
MSSDILIQHSNAAIVVLNTDFTVVEANEAFLKKVQKTKEEVVGAFCFQISYGLDAPCPNARPDLPCPMIETLRTGRSSHVIHEISDIGSEGTYGVIVTYPLIDSQGEIIRIIEICHDISEEIEFRWDQRYTKMKSEFNNLLQEDRMISMGKLAASCVHEINNPIQGLLTFTGLMQSTLAAGELSPEDVDEFKNYLALMSTELERCGKIVTGLLSFSREKTLQYQVIDMNTIIQSVISLAEHNMQLRGVELQTDLSASALTIAGDTSRLQQCLLNLVFNAIEAMPDGGVLNFVSGLDEAHRQIIVEIKDTGCGIAKEHLDRIFEPFFTTKTDGQGTGLGLSIVYNVVKAHFGDIKTESQPGQGCRFVLTFPQAETAGIEKV